LVSRQRCHRESNLSNLERVFSALTYTHAKRKDVRKHWRRKSPPGQIKEVMERKTRTGVNPQTRATIQIPAKKVPKFRPGKSLREKVK